MECGYYDARRCRSCTLLPVPYQDQLAAKTSRAVGALPDDLQWWPAVAGPEHGFRNRAKLVVAGTSRRPTLGILDGHGRGVDLRRCALYEAPITAAQPVLSRFISRLGLVPYDVPRRRGEVKYLLLTASPTGELMLRIVLRSRRHLDTIRTSLPQLLAELPALTVVSVNLHPEHKAVLEGEEEIVLTPESTLTMPVNGLRLQLGVRSFFQTNTAVAAALYAQAAAWAQDLNPENVWDLFCGVGGFALSLAAPGRRVLGVELSAEAIRSAERAAAELDLPGATVSFRAGDATALARSGGAEPARPPGTGSVGPDTVPDLIVVNPPRRGLGPELSQWLDRSGAAHVLYSSCNVESLQRDLVQMPGLIPRQARVFDLFPHTDHFEVLVQLDRRPGRVPGRAAGAHAGSIRPGRS